MNALTQPGPYPPAGAAPAIGWPASLDRPAAEQLAAIAAAPGAVAAGYGVNLLFSILIAPVMIALATRRRGGLASPLGLTVAASARCSACRCSWRSHSACSPSARCAAAACRPGSRSSA
jgi:hypothetical protein